MDLILFLLVCAILLALGYFASDLRGKKHLKQLKKREEALRPILVIPSRIPPDYKQKAYRTEFVCGSVVVAMNYFKVIIGHIVKFFGGQINDYEILLERARREAVVRMKEEASLKRAQMVFNVKFSTAPLSKESNGINSGLIEVIAYGTAIVYL